MPRPSDFQKRVMHAVSRIPFGQTRSYKWVAKKAGCPGAYRAVGSILKKNKNLFIVPCHRVVKSSGGIGEYSLGKDIKEMLLGLEKRLTNKR